MFKEILHLVMKQGLKIILFVLPQLFALLLKANVSCAGTSARPFHQNNFHQAQDEQFNKVTNIDEFKDFESEFEDEFIPDFFNIPPKRLKIPSIQLEGSYGEFFQSQHAVRLYILYSSLRIHC